MDAANFSNTPVTAYLEMGVLRFFEVWQAIVSVQERRNKRAAERTSSAPRPRKARKKRR